MRTFHRLINEAIITSDTGLSEVDWDLLYQFQEQFNLLVSTLELIEAMSPNDAAYAAPEAARVARAKVQS